MTESKSFTAVGVGPELLVRRGASFAYDVSGTFVGTVKVEQEDRGGWTVLTSKTAAASGTLTVESNKPHARVRVRCSAFTSGTIVTSLTDETGEATDKGFVQPLLLVGADNADFNTQTGYRVSEPAPVGYAVFGVCNLADDAAAQGGDATGAMIGSFDTHDVGAFGAVSALQLDATKTGAGDSWSLEGISLFVWNQGAGNISQALMGFTVGLESDGGEVGTAVAINVQQPSIDAMPEGARAIGLYMKDQTVAAADVNYAIDVNEKFFVGPDGGFIEGVEVTAPSAPAANHYRIYAVDNAGKTELLVRFGSGAAQRLSIEP